MHQNAVCALAGFRICAGYSHKSDQPSKDKNISVHQFPSVVEQLGFVRKQIDQSALAVAILSSLKRIGFEENTIAHSTVTL